MASYHFCAKPITRGSQHNAVKAAAYRARASLTDERTGETHDYTRHRSRCLFEGIYAPKDAPEWAKDRAQLWNHVEAFEKHRRAELAREYDAALPHEMTLEQQRWLLQDFVRENFTRKGLIADVTIHEAGREGDQRNTHAHIMVVTRKLDGSEFVKRKDQYATFTEKEQAKKAELLALREAWAKVSNRHLERHGYEDRIDHRTLEAQGIDREPTIHRGKAADAMERRGLETGRGDENRAIDRRNREAANQNEAQARRDWTEQQIAEANSLSLDELAKAQRDLLVQKAAERAELAAEDRPYHAEAGPRVVLPGHDQVQPQLTAEAIRQREAEDAKRERGTPESDLRRALAELAVTDPLQFAQAAAAARESMAVASWQLPTVRISVGLGAAWPTPAPEQTREAAREAQEAARPAPEAQVAPTPSQAPQRPAQDAQRQELAATILPATPDNATQRASYEAEKTAEVDHAAEIAGLRRIIEAGRDRLANLAGRLETAWQAVLGRQQAEPGRDHQAETYGQQFARGLRGLWAKATGASSPAPEPQQPATPDPRPSPLEFPPRDLAPEKRREDPAQDPSMKSPEPENPWLAAQRQRGQDGASRPPPSANRQPEREDAWLAAQRRREKDRASRPQPSPDRPQDRPAEGQRSGERQQRPTPEPPKPARDSFYDALNAPPTDEEKRWLEERRRRQLERDRDNGRDMHHRPRLHLQDVLGFVRRHYHRRKEP